MTPQPATPGHAAPTAASLGRYVWATLACVVLFVVTLVLYVDAVLRSDRAEAERARALALAEELHQTSDDLTDMVRSYVVTSDPHYRKNFQEILDIRDGKQPRPAAPGGFYWDLASQEGSRGDARGRQVALLDLAHEAGFTGAELAKL